MSLWRAASEGNAKQLSAMLRSGKAAAGCNITNTLGQTPLHVAVIAGQAECVSVLLADPSLDVNRRDADLGWTPLHYAVFKKFPRIAVMLAARGAEIDVLDHAGFSPVDLAFVDTYPPPRRDDFDLEQELPSHGQAAAASSPASKPDEVFGELFTWGEGSNYCLGHGNPNSVAQPKRVTSLPQQQQQEEDSVVQVSTSDFSTGVVTRLGRLFTFGVGTGGRLGHGDTEIRLVPKRVAGPLLAKRIVGVSMGLAHTAAVADDGSVFTWGSGAFGQLGHGTTDDSLTPRKIRGGFEGQKPIAVAAGRHHTAVLTSKGGVWTFGYGENGELGYLADALAKKAYCHCTPRQVVMSIEAPVVAIAVGKAHTACTTQAGDVYLLGFGSPQARRLFLPTILPSAFAGYQQAAAAASSLSSPSRVLPTPVYSISPSQTSFSVLSGDSLSAPPTAAASRGHRLLTSLVASGNMTLAVFNRRDVFLSDLYHVDGLHTRIPKPIYIPVIPGNNTIASAALNTNKEIVVVTDAGHLWTCVENKEKAREWVWRRISVGKRFTQVACSRNHYAAIARKEALVKETVDISPWSLSAHLLNELENDDFTDVEFVMDDGRRVPAHKIVLAMRGQHFASLFAAEDEDGGDAEAPVWGESDYNVPGMGANHLRPRKRREVKVDQTAFPLFHKFIRLVYTDASDPAAPKLSEGDKGQLAPLLKRFKMHSISSSSSSSSRDKARAKGKERVVETDEDENAAHATLSTPPPPAGAAVGSLSRFETELRAAFFDERLTDVDLISSEEDRIPCHQVIICSQSEVFRTMMTIGMLESHRSEIFIQNASTDTLQKVKEFLYLGNFAVLLEGGEGGLKKVAGGGREAIPFGTVMELLNISNQFMLQRMKETLEHLLLHQYLDYDNLVSLLITAENYSCHNLKRQLFEFARRHFITLLQGNVVRALLDHPDYAYLLDDLDYFVQSGGKLRDVDEDYADERDGGGGETAEEAERRQAEADELLTYFSEEEIQNQKEMEAFWERERLIEKEREKQKANEQRRRAAKHAKVVAAKARRAKAARVAKSVDKSQLPLLARGEGKGKEKDNDGAADDDDDDAERSSMPWTTTVPPPPPPPEEDPRRVQLRALVERANKALGKDYAGANEEATRVVKRLRAAKKKLSQIDSLLDKQAKGEELDEAQLAKLDQGCPLADEIAALFAQLEEATRPPPPPHRQLQQLTPVAPVVVAPAPPAPTPTTTTTTTTTTSPAKPAPTGPVAYQKKRDNDDSFFFSAKAAANRNRRRTNSTKTAAPTAAAAATTHTPVPPAPATAPSLAPWAAKKPVAAAAEKPSGSSATAATPAAAAGSPQKAKSLLQIQEEETAALLRRREETASRPTVTAPRQQRTIKRLDGSFEKQTTGPPRPQHQQQQQQQQQAVVVGNADNESSSPTKNYAISLAIGGKLAVGPVRVTVVGDASQRQPNTTNSAAPSLRSSTNGVGQPAAATTSRATQQSQSVGRVTRSAALFPPLGASSRAPSLVDIQREERERAEAERRKREVVQPTKKPLKQIQEEQEEARKVQALFGDELKQIYGHDIDLESIW